MNRDNEPTNPMTAENVEQFDVWIFDSSELVVSIIPIDAPGKQKQIATRCPNKRDKDPAYVQAGDLRGPTKGRWIIAPEDCSNDNAAIGIWH